MGTRICTLSWTFQLDPEQIKWWNNSCCLATNGITTQCLNRYAPAQDFKVKRHNWLKFRKSIHSIHKHQIKSWTCSHLSNYTSNHFKSVLLNMSADSRNLPPWTKIPLSSTCIISMTSQDFFGCPNTFFTNAEQRFTNSPATQPCSNLGKDGPGRLHGWGWSLKYASILPIVCLN